MVGLICILGVVKEEYRRRIIDKKNTSVRMSAIQVGIIPIARIGGQNANVMTGGQELLLDLSYCKGHPVIKRWKQHCSENTRISLVKRSLQQRHRGHTNKRTAT